MVLTVHFKLLCLGKRKGRYFDVAVGFFVKREVNFFLHE